MRLLGPRERKKSKENFLLAPARRKRSENFFVFLFRRTNFRSPQKFCVFRQVIEPNKPPLSLEIEPLVNEFEVITARRYPIESKTESERERKTTNAFHSFVIRAIERTGRFLMMLSNRILKFKMWPNGRWGYTTQHMPRWPQNRNMSKVNSYCRGTNEALLTIRGVTTVLRSRSNNS